MAHRAKDRAVAPRASAKKADRQASFAALLASPFAAIGDMLSAVIAANSRTNPPR